MPPLGRALLVLLVLASAGLGWHLLRRNGGPVAYWILGWAAAGLSGAIALAGPAVPAVQYFAHPFGTLFAALLVAGSLAFAGRRVPGWLLPAALGWGCLRALVAATVSESLAWLLALLWEPWAVLVGAALVWRSARDPRSTRGERWLGPALGVLAIVGALHVLWLAVGGAPEELVTVWVVVSPPLLGLQIQATADRLRRRTREVLEARVAERTAALLASEERYRAVSELSADLAFRARIDPELHLTSQWTAGAVAAITGREPESLEGHGWLLLLPERERAELRGRLAALPLGRRFEFERSIVGPQGETRWVSVRVVAASRAGDGTVDVTGSAGDVTERRRAEEEQRRLESHLQQMQRLESLGVLAGGIAHDFNNLLTVIGGHALLALAELPPGVPLCARLERIREAAEHAAALTGQMLAYAGKAAPELGPLDVGEVVGSLGELLRAAMPEAGRLEIECAPDLPAVEGDRGQLGQVVLNLALNAADALVDGAGRVAIRVGVTDLDAGAPQGALGAELAPGRHVVLEVRDDGRGMDAATAERVCEPF
ncbi:MAG TPA: PAS domain S-box protein, partial [Myxococcota bacterium]|nr:PAS domain S-box protein [Myxococcota bacterium]